MAQKIQGSQHDFSFGEVDVSLKRADEHPARKGGLRQMSNMRILNSGGIQDRPGRTARFPIQNSSSRIEKFTISSGNNFHIAFAPGRVQIIGSSGVIVGNFTTKGSGAALPWATQADINSIVYVVFELSVTITFGHLMRPQVITWDGVSTWSIADFTELLIGGQKRTPFYRISPQNIFLTPGGATGTTGLVSSQPLFVAGHVGTRMRFVGRQMLITAVTNPTTAVVAIQESLPGGQVINFGPDPHTVYGIGDEVIGSVSNAKGVIFAIGSLTITVQLLSTSSSISVVTGGGLGVTAFVQADTVVGPGGSLPASTVNAIGTPVGCTAWDDEIMNDFRGYPASCFVDQFRMGFCDFPSVPGGIAWSAINSQFDLYVDVNPSNAMFEIAPAKTRVLYVVPGPESNEFVFCDTRLYYIPISPTNPLKPGSVQFQILSGDGCASVQPRLSQEVIIYANAGANTVMAVIATGAYLRPFNTKNLTDYHAHLFSSIVAIAVPTADTTFNERYAYVLSSTGALVVGKYNLGDFSTDTPRIGWGPWSGTGAISWVEAWNSEVHFTSNYFGTGIYEILDDTQYLDAALLVNALPAAFAAPVGKGPLWWIPSQSVSLIDQATRSMGTYQIDANGFIIPQNNGGENLAASSLVAGQPWTSTVEPFAPDANSGADAGQRMKMRQISNFEAYVIQSSGFLLGYLFSARQTRTSPPLGTLMNFRRFPAWNQDDDATLPPPTRETVETYPPMGSTFDPRAVLIKDTPGPFQLLEIGIEVSI